MGDRGPQPPERERRQPWGMSAHLGAFWADRELEYRPPRAVCRR
uniref:Uncharacterized protein n=1 Tax=Podoviridae sp. ctzMH52 TaxID=2826596 RepID=A0A8S5N392_9CAUD|nr:MAG TPA: hypothetical protein [Podoviridae sp. ctzMH52]